MNSINIHVYPSSITHESRIMKETLTISKLEFIKSIFILGIWEKGLSKIEKIDSKRTIIRYKLYTSHLSDNNLGKAIKFSEWMIRIFFRFLRRDLVLVNIHNLGVLPLGALFKIFKKIKLIYDTHELETERDCWSKFRIRISRLLEKTFIKFVDNIIVVSPSIADWYRKKYNKKALTVYNSSYFSEVNKKDLFREIFKIPKDKIIFLFQGFFKPNRGIEHILEAFKGTDTKDKVIIFLGSGPLEDRIKEASKTFPDIYFHPIVNSKELLQYTSSADIAFCLTENTCLNHYLTIPNKVFEYAMAGIPSVASNMLALQTLVNSNKIGYVLKKIDKESIKNFLSSVNNEAIMDFKKELTRFNKNFNWENEEKSLHNLYNNIFSVT